MTGQSGHVIVKLKNVLLGSSPADILLHGDPVNVHAGDIPESYVGIKKGTVNYVGNKPMPAKNLLKPNPKYILPAHIDR